MVIGIIGLLAVGAIPTTIGVGQAISAQKKQDVAAKEQAKFHLTALLPDGDEASCVLVDGKASIPASRIVRTENNPLTMQGSKALHRSSR
jgi:hypothetical protein